MIAVPRLAFLGGLVSFAFGGCVQSRATRVAADIGVTVIGDYLAAGSGATDPREAFAYSAVVTTVDRRLRFLESFAMPAGLTRDVANVQAGQIEVDTQIVIVATGSADVAGGTPPTVFADDYASALRRIDRRAPKRRLLCCGLPDPALLDSHLRDRYPEPQLVLDAFEDTVKTLCRDHGGAFVKLNGLITDESHVTGAYRSPDQTHPSSLGYALLEPRLERAMRAALADIDRRPKNAMR